ncbi:Phosphoribosylanthranilate isomerase [hydrothermal vent metagenome]|uniref:phosphoribosylanthranilate isomerase n=1 Tax=hydrothermal vent metagenome TaxID=652676 RepID=A0A3B1CCW2_9ZZZZ
MKIKICGQTSVKDADMSLDHGADFIGAVMDVDWSPRSLNEKQIRPIFAAQRERAFLLTFNAEITPALEKTIESLDPYAIQLTGRETFETVAFIKSVTSRLIFKSIHLFPADGEKASDPEMILRLMDGYSKAGADGFVLDTAVKGMYGGTGVTNDWSIAAMIAKSAPGPVFLAGGINPENVVEASGVPYIYGIDLASGVESAKGVKSGEKLISLFGAINKTLA